MRTALEGLDGTEYDVVIVGGGITWTSSAQELAARGYHVLLVDRHDFGGGTSSRSSRLMHFGLRHIGPDKSLWEFVRSPLKFIRQVRSAVEAAKSYGIYVRTIPNRLRKTEITFPVSKRAIFASWHVDVANWFLCLLAPDAKMAGYKRLPAAQGQSDVFIRSLGNPDELRDVLTFTDYQFDWPERICVDCALDAERMGATVRNYTEVVSLERTGAHWKVQIRNSEGGNATATVTGRFVLNAAGVWTDEVNRNATQFSPSRKVIPVKGIHVVVSHPNEFRGRGVVSFNSRGEHIFCLPWGERHYIGPGSESVYEGDLQDVFPEEREISGLLDEINWLFPRLDLKRDDVLFSWAGVRPITYDPAFPKGRRMPFGVVHDFRSDGIPNLLAVTWNTIHIHRLIARRVAKKISARIPARGKSRSIGARQVFSEIKPACDNRVTALSHGEIEHLCRNEHVHNLMDLLYRRSSLAWWKQIEDSELASIARSAGSALNWDPDRVAREIARFKRHRERFHPGARPSISM